MHAAKFGTVGSYDSHRRDDDDGKELPKTPKESRFKRDLRVNRERSRIAPQGRDYVQRDGGSGKRRSGGAVAEC